MKVIRAILLTLILLPAAGVAQNTNQRIENLNRTVAQLEDTVARMKTATDEKLIEIKLLLQQTLESANKANTSVTIFEGQIREREEAQRLYTEAKASGRKASLVEQKRPNIFTTSVANIGPQETVEVAIEFQDTVAYDGAEFALRFPLVVAPRYLPGADEGDGICDDPSFGSFDGARSVAQRLAPPLAAGEPVNPVRLSVELDPG